MMMVMMGFWLIVPLCLLGAAYYVMSRRSQIDHTRLAPTSQTPIEILKARYAGGEINREEYDQILLDLEG